MRSASLVALAALGLAGCSTLPPMQTPSVATPAQFRHAASWSHAAPGDHLDRGEWWRAFGDPVLDGLMGRLDERTPTLAAALARYDRALAAARATRADLFPSVDLSGSASRERLSSGRPIGPGTPIIANQYIFGIGLNYELDLWGRVRNSVRAARADAQAQEAALHSARLSLQASVADTYIQLRAIDAEQGLLARTVAAFTRADDLIRTRYEGGIASGVDRSRSLAQLANARARSEALKAQRSALEHRIAALVGEPASSFTIAPAENKLTLPEFPAGLPSELLQRRPDIAEAQRRLVAANARIGVARSAFYPSINLGLGAGYQATEAPVISADTLFWGLGPVSTLLNLFDGGQRRARLAISRADYAELAAAYRQTVLDGFQEVEDGLSRSNALANQDREQRIATGAAARAEQLAFDRYRDGAADYLEVVTAQTAALSAQQASIAVSFDRARTAIALVRALGGGTPTAT